MGAGSNNIKNAKMQKWIEYMGEWEWCFGVERVVLRLLKLEGNFDMMWLCL
jgi:hypothetical protein